MFYFFSSVTTDFKIYSALRWAIQDHCPLVSLLPPPVLPFSSPFSPFSFPYFPSPPFVPSPFPFLPIHPTSLHLSLPQLAKLKLKVISYIISLAAITLKIAVSAFFQLLMRNKPEDHWSCIADLSSEVMLKSAVIEEKKFKNIESDWTGPMSLNDLDLWYS